MLRCNVIIRINRLTSNALNRIRALSLVELKMYLKPANVSDICVLIWFENFWFVFSKVFDVEISEGASDFVNTLDCEYVTIDGVEYSVSDDKEETEYWYDWFFWKQNSSTFTYGKRAAVIFEFLYNIYIIIKFWGLSNV